MNTSRDDKRSGFVNEEKLGRNSFDGDIRKDLVVVMRKFSI